MTILVLGLGSMGKRRVRCLKALGYTDIIGYDPRADRRAEAETLYAIRTAGSADDALFAQADVLVISTPPDKHLDYMRAAVEHGKPAFIEASVLLDGLDALDAEALRKGVLLAPSCTLRFHPAVRDIARIVKSGEYGAVTNFSYHSGQYLPDWHPWEPVTDYYVSNRATGAAREIVPFELTWLTEILGLPVEVTGLHGATMDVGADIDDTYMVVMRFAQGMGSLTVDVVARHATRTLVLNLERGQILWNWNEGCVHLYDAVNERWVILKQKEGAAHSGYNKNIIEDMYIDEVRAFMDHVRGTGVYPHTLRDDINVLTILYTMEHRQSV